MPELPEMEQYKTLLQKRISGKAITNATIQREKSINIPVADFTKQVTKQKVTAISRRAKYLIFHLENGGNLLLHLMLGGWLFYGKADEKPDRTVQVKLSFGEEHLYFIGLRLGYLHYQTASQLEAKLDHLGPEPLTDQFSLDLFLQQLKTKRGALKTSLLDQDFIAGIGNRYSDEILWQAQLSPKRKVAELENQEHSCQLYEAIQTVLRAAIQLGGYMEHPFYNGDEQTGGALGKMNVHDREGETCSRCGHPIVKIVLSSRKTFYCQVCQK